MMSQATNALLLGVLISAVAGCAPRPEADVAPSPGPLPSDRSAAGPSILAIGLPIGLQVALKDLQDRFAADHPQTKLEFHEREVEGLVRDVKSGKLVLDIILAQGELELKPLLDAGLVEGPGTPIFSRSMELIVPRGNPRGLKSLADLARDEVREVVVATPETSLGQASEQALSKAGVLDKLTQAGKLRRVSQPLEAKRLVAAAKADAALVYSAARRPGGGTADPVRSAEGKVDTVLTVPETEAGPLVVVAVVLKSAPSPELSEEFISFLQTPTMQEALALRGYGRVQQ
ncbi:MAG: substrate-binding domain-containing protein [Armatimonadetes bacterium]|nr:substrate-binding domain-containing protein [Armatimonadota bacterium]